MVQYDLPKPDSIFQASKKIKTAQDILKASKDFKKNAKQFETDIKELKSARNELVKLQLALSKDTDQLIRNLVDVMTNIKHLEMELESIAESMKEFDRDGTMWTRRTLDHIKALENMSDTYDKAEGVKRVIARKAYEKAFNFAASDMMMASIFMEESEKSRFASSQIVKLDYIDKLKKLSKVMERLKPLSFRANVMAVEGTIEKAVKLTKQANK